MVGAGGVLEELVALAAGDEGGDEDVGVEDDPLSDVERAVARARRER